MKTTKKCAALLLAVLLSALPAVSCSKTAQDEDTPAGSSVSEQTETEPAEETEASYPVPVLPDKDYGGATFNIMSRVNGTVGYYDCEIDAEEETGEAINDLVFRRNTEIEDRFNIDIVGIPGDSPVKQMTTLIKAQDDTYSFFVENLQGIRSHQ